MSLIGALREEPCHYKAEPNVVYPFTNRKIQDYICVGFFSEYLCYWALLLEICCM